MDIVDIVDTALWMLCILWTLINIMDSVDICVKGYPVGRSPQEDRHVVGGTRSVFLFCVFFGALEMDRVSKAQFKSNTC